MGLETLAEGLATLGGVHEGEKETNSRELWIVQSGRKSA